MTALVNKGDLVSVEIGDLTIETWMEYSIDSDLLTPADAFTLTLAFAGSASARARVREQIEEQSGLTCKIYLARDANSPTDRSLQMTGIIDRVSIASSRERGSTLTIKGRDKAALLCSSTADPRLTVSEDTSLVEAIRAVVAPYGIEVVTEAAPSRLLMTGARAQLPIAEVTAAYARSIGVPAEAVPRAVSRRLASGREPLDNTLYVIGDNAQALSARGGLHQTRGLERARRGHGSGMTGSDVERLTMTQAKPQVGETVWDFIERHCSRFHSMMWMSADGNLIIGSPDYDQAPSYTLTRDSWDPSRNNIIEGGSEKDFGGQCSEVTVYGRSSGSDATRGRLRARVRPGDAQREALMASAASLPAGSIERARAESSLSHITVTSNALPEGFYRPLVIHDPSVRTEEEAEARAYHELAVQASTARVLEYEVQDHGVGGLFYAIDTVADVRDDDLGVSGIYYVTQRTFTRSRAQGARTRLRLVPVGAIEP